MDQPADVWSIVLLPWCIRLIRFQVMDGRGTELRHYHTAVPAGPVATHIARALDSLAETGTASPTARQLLVILLQQIRQQLSEDVFVWHEHWRALGMWHMIRDHLGAQFNLGITRKSVAKAFNLHPSYVSMLAKRYSGGQSFHQILENIRLTHARRLLAETDLKLAAIAAECGFHDAVRLAKVFRRVEGTTPSRFRAQRHRPRAVDG